MSISEVNDYEFINLSDLCLALQNLCLALENYEVMTRVQLCDEMVLISIFEVNKKNLIYLS